MPVVYGEINMSKEKRPASIFGRQQQLVNSGNNISFPRIF